MDPTTKIEIGYWKVQGMVQPIKYALEYLELPYEMTYFMSFTEWMDRKPNLGMDFPNIPYLINGNDRISESTAVMRYLCEKFQPSLLGSTLEERVAAQTCWGVVNDVFTAFVQANRNTGPASVEETKQKMEAFYSGIYQLKLSIFDKRFGTNNYSFINGRNICFVDFFFFYTLDITFRYNPSVLTLYPNVVKYFDRVRNLPQIKRYRESDTFLIGIFPGILFHWTGMEEAPIDIPNEPQLHENLKSDEMSNVDETIHLVVNKENEKEEIKTDRNAENQSLSRRITIKSQAIWRNSKILRIATFFIVAGSIYLDHISTLLTIKQLVFEFEYFLATLTGVIYGLNLLVRFFFNNQRKGHSQFRKSKLLYSLFLLDIVLPQYKKYALMMSENPSEEEIAELHNNLDDIFDIGVITISSDSLPHALITLYSQASNNSISSIIMISTLTSLFSLARNLSDFVYNPFISLENQMNNKRKGFTPQNVLESLFEMWDTYIELLYRICLLVAFIYVSVPYGIWLYFSWIGLLYVGYLTGSSQESTGMFILNCLSGLPLAAIHSKSTRFYHPLTEYRPLLESNGEFVCRGFIFIEISAANYWRLFQIISILGPFIYSCSQYSSMNRFVSVVFILGIVCMGYTVFNYIFDLYSIKESNKNLVQNFKEPMNYQKLVKCIAYLQKYPQLKGELGKLCAVIKLIPQLLNIKKIEYQENLHALIYEEIKHKSLEEINLDIMYDGYQAYLLEKSDEKGGTMIIYEPEAIKGDSVAKILVNKLQLKKDIKHFVLNLKNLDFGTTIFAILGDQKTLPLGQITNFSILGGEKLTKIHLEALNLSSCLQLTYLKIEISKNYNADEIIVCIGSILEKIELIKLYLDFENTELSGNSLISLEEIIKRNSKLTHLGLNIIKCKNITRNQITDFYSHSKSQISDFEICMNEDIEIKYDPQLYMKKSFPSTFWEHYLIKAGYKFVSFLNKFETNDSLESLIITTPMGSCVVNQHCKLVFTLESIYSKFHTPYLPRLHELHLGNFSNIDINEISKFADCLGRESHLEKLHFIFQVKDPHLVPILQELLIQQKKLRTVDLNFIQCTTDLSSVKRLLQGLQSSALTLNDLSLSLMNCQNLDKSDEQSSFDSTFNKIQNCINLNSFTLKLPGNNDLQDSTLKYLWNSLETIPRLNKICCDFQECPQLSCVGLELIANVLSRGTNALLNLEKCSGVSVQSVMELCNNEKLEIMSAHAAKLRFNDITTFQNYWVHLNSLDIHTQFVSLDLYLGQIQLEESDTRLQILSHSMLLLTNLQRLKISLDNCQKITELEMMNFSESINQLQNLQFVQIKYFNCLNLSDAGVKKLAKSISSHLKLRTLSLEFWNCLKVTDDSLEDLARALDYLNDLQELSVVIWNAQKVTDVGLRRLGSSIQRKQQLRKLELDLAGSTSTSKGTESLVTSFNSSKTIQILKINVSGLLTVESAEENPDSMRTLQQLNFYSSRCSEISDISIEKLGISIDAITELHSLDLKLCNSENLTNEGLQNLSSSLLFQTSILTLKINLANCSNISDIGIDDLGRVIASQRQLQRFDIDLSGACMSDVGIQKISTALPTTLRTLKIKFTNCLSLTENGIELISNSLSSLKLMSTLILNFDFCSAITELAVEKLGVGLNSLSCLQSLGLSFRKCPKLNDKGAVKLGSYLKPISKLQNFDLNVTGSAGITDIGASALGSSIPSGSSLQSLKLSLKDLTNLADPTIISLSNEFKIMRNLKNLDFSLGGSGTQLRSIKDEGVKIFSAGIKFLTGLEHLNIDFMACNLITDQSLIELAPSIGSLSLLKSLTFDFSSCHKVTDIGIEPLIANTRCLTLLQHFKFYMIGFMSSYNFEQQSGLSDVGIATMSQSIESFKSLQTLILHFHNCNKIGDVGLGKLSSAISHLNFIQNLAINLLGCQKISDQGLTNLGTALQQSKSIQSLELYFWNSPDITNEGIQNLCYGLETMVILQNLSLSFWKCSKISDFGIDILAQALLSLDSLQNLLINLVESAITDFGMKSLSFAVSSLSFLRNLNLNLAKTSFFDDGINYLASSLSSLKYIENFELCCLENMNLTDKGIETLCDAIDSHGFLQFCKIEMQAKAKGRNRLDNLKLKPLKSWDASEQARIIQ